MKVVGRLAGMLSVFLFALFFSSISHAAEDQEGSLTFDSANAFQDPHTGEWIQPFEVDEDGNVTKIYTEEEYLEQTEGIEEIDESSLFNDDLTGEDDDEVHPMRPYYTYWEFDRSSKRTSQGSTKKVTASISCSTSTCSISKTVSATSSNSFSVSASSEKSAIRAGAGFTWVSSKSASSTVRFNLKKGERGYIGFKPKYNRVDGYLRQYNNWDGKRGGPMQSKFAVGYSVKKLSNGQADGTFRFIYER